MMSIDEKFRDEDGFLYATYSETNLLRRREENMMILNAVLIPLPGIVLICLACIWALQLMFRLAALLWRIFNFGVWFWILVAAAIWIMVQRVHL